MASCLGGRSDLVVAILSSRLAGSPSRLGRGLFLFGWLAPPADWRIGAAALRGLGALMWAVVLGYLALCAFSPRREFRWRGHDFFVPSLRIALMQLLIASANWLTIGAVLWVLLQQDVDYGHTLAVLLVAANLYYEMSDYYLPWYRRDLAIASFRIGDRSPAIGSWHFLPKDGLARELGQMIPAPEQIVAPPSLQRPLDALLNEPGHELPIVTPEAANPKKRSLYVDYRSGRSRSSSRRC